VVVGLFPVRILQNSTKRYSDQAIERNLGRPRESNPILRYFRISQ